MKLISIILFCITLSVPHQLRGCEANGEKWSRHELVNSIVLGEDDTGKGSIKVKLIEPETVIGGKTGGYDTKDDETISTYGIVTANHGFLYTSDGDLFIDNFYAGRFSTKDDLVYGNGRIWSNGIPYFMKKMTNNQIKNIYNSDMISSQPDKPVLVYKDEWNIYLYPGESGGMVSKIGNSFIYSNGMTVVRVEEGKVIVNGMNYGPIIKGQEIKIIDCIVSLDNKTILPVSVARQPSDAPKVK